MNRKTIIAAMAALALGACGASEADEAAPQSEYAAIGPATEEAGSAGAAPSAPPADGAAAPFADTWRCKAQDNIPIGVLEIAASGDYEFIVVKNSLWEPKPADPGNGNGNGRLGAPDGQLKPLDGPLTDEYGILGIASHTDEYGTKIYLNNHYGTLLVCLPASRGG